MNKSLSKTAVVTLTLAAILATSAFMTLPTTNAESWTMTPYIYLTAIPNPVQVNQPAYVTGWLDLTPPYPLSWGGTPWQGITIEVREPDGATETLGPFTADTISGFWALYTPDQIGTYTFTAHFPGQTINVPDVGIAAGQWLNVVGDHYFEPSDSWEVELVVQSDPIPTWQDTPVPDSNTYWTRPISAVHRNWNTIAGNWLSNPTNAYAAYTRAPETAHINWAKPVSLGGLVGGAEYDSHAYHQGLAYEGRWLNPVVINGVLYYKEYGHGHSQYWTDIVAVDLRTGEELWRNNSTGRGDPVDVRLTGGGGQYGNWEGYPTLSFGQIYYYSSPNQHGAFGYLWATGGRGDTARWDMYDAFTGDWIMSLTGVPSGTRTFGPNGEILIYQIDTRNGWMALWNSSDAIPIGGPLGTDAWQYRLWPGATIDVSEPYMWEVTGAGGPEFLVDPYTWNVSIPTDLPGRIWAVLDDRIIGYNLGTTYYSYDPWTVWAISLKPGEEGQLMWRKDYHAPAGNITMQTGVVSAEDGVFVLREKETIRWVGYDLDTGEQIWGPTESQVAWDIFEPQSAVAYGNFYTVGYGGVIYCYDISNGNLKWTYEASDPTGEGLYGQNFPLKMGTIADGKVYVVTSEHSPIDPLPRGARLRCVDAYEGNEIWTIPHWSAVQHGTYVVIADGYLVDLDSYDMQLYAFGKGETETIVSASPKVVSYGRSVLIEGTVTDQSPGAKDLPAIADADMTEWMKYVYKQYPLSQDVNGVPVTLTAVSSNGDTVTIGTVTSDASGMFKAMWTPPDADCEYSIVAAFDGTKSYWPSCAETAVGVEAAQAGEVVPTPSVAPPPTTGNLPTETYIVIAAVAIIIVALAAVAMVLRRKK
ncbi:MAG: PQQ-binding-like beta-propeller repeat protein [Candidatus Bathyarchaeota archaeon]|nr:PQQ-binding-like beta-propeller repeat protein [Candidatus Bathyarchaeota archaeon]